MTAKRGIRALVVLILVVAVAHVAWLYLDQGPIPTTDDYRYLSATLRLLDSVRGEASGRGVTLTRLNPTGRPPLYQLVALPLVALGGRSSDAAVAVNILYLALLMLATYWLASVRHGPPAGLLAALVVSCMPPIIHQAHGFRPQAALAACVAVSLWLLMLVLERRTPVPAFAFAVSLAFGAFTHPAYAFVIAVPTAFGFFASFGQSAKGGTPRTWLTRGLLHPSFLRGWLPGGLLAGGLVLTWYLTAGQGLWKTLLRSSSPEVAAVRDHAVRVPPGLGQPSTIWWYLRTAPVALGTVVAWQAVAAWTIAVVTARRASDWLLPVTILGAFAVLSSLSAYTWMYAAPVLPAVAVLVAVWATNLRSVPLRGLMVTLLAISSVLAFLWTSWGRAAPTRNPVLAALGARVAAPPSCRGTLTFCPAPPEPTSINAERVLARILDDPSCQPPKRCRLMVIGAHGVNAQMLNFHRVSRWPSAKLKISTPGTGAYGGRFPLGALFDSRYVLHQRLGPNPRVARRIHERTNYLAAALMLFHELPPSVKPAYEPLAEIEVAGKPMTLLRRLGHFTPAQRSAIASSLAVDARGRR